MNIPIIHIVKHASTAVHYAADAAEIFMKFCYRNVCKSTSELSSMSFKTIISIFVITMSASCNLSNEIIVNYKMTIVYRDAHGVRSASAARRMRIKKLGTWPFATTDMAVTVRGQAVIMPIGDRRAYALLEWEPNEDAGLPEPGDFARGTIPKLMADQPVHEKMMYNTMKLGLEKNNYRTNFIIAKSHWPAIVYFENENDSRSVSVCGISNNNCGIKIISITIYPHSDGYNDDNIANYLPWLRQKRKSMLDGVNGITSSRPKSLLYSGSFLMED